MAQFKPQPGVTLRGVIIRERYRMENFAIASFRMIGEDQRLTGETIIKGPLLRVSPEEMVTLVGEWVNDPKWGEQFSVTDCFRIMPTTVQGVINYLAGAIDGIGPALAQRMADKFGSALPTILEENPQRLIEVKGVSERLLQRITKSWQSDHRYRNLRIWLARYGFPVASQSRIIEHFGGRTSEILNSNPYRLTDVKGIGFTSADRMAQMMGWPRKSHHRTVAATVYCLQEAIDKGNVFLHRDQLMTQLHLVGRCTEEEGQAALNEVVGQGDITHCDFPSELGTQTVYYLPNLYAAEVRLASRVAQLNRAKPVPNGFEEQLKRVQYSMEMDFTPKQVEAIRAAFSHRLSVLTGPPGTGKTSTLKAVVQLARYLNCSFALAAPTGRAAKRLAEITGEDAQTIHRLLKYDGDNSRFFYGQGNPLPYKLIIIDEASMVDLELADKFLDAVEQDSTVVMVGDVDQLPAVGPGSVLRDLLESRVLKVTILDQIFRQAEESLIIQNAHRIRKGLPPTFPPKGSKADCYLMEVPSVRSQEKGKSMDDIDWVKDKLRALCVQHIPQKFQIDPIRDIQVLVPMKKGTCGAPELNQILQEALNPRGREFVVPGGKFRLGDRVQQHKNDYTLEVFNGDVGIIKSINHEDKTILIEFYGREVAYPFVSTNNLGLAYAITIHRSQGSEYPCVIIVMLSQHYAMLERNLLYTANTRARRLCLYLSTHWAMEHAAENARAGTRNSFLGERIRQAMQQQTELTTTP